MNYFGVRAIMLCSLMKKRTSAHSLEIVISLAPGLGVKMITGRYPET
jgi:hypothetical protein